jgi:NitT/TauT family transport system substrate-binding protein
LPGATITHAFANVQITYDPLVGPLLLSADHAYALGYLGETKPDLSGLFDLRPLNAVLKGEGIPPVNAA